jgi:co-chaperonin GroES (HSP10)
MEHVTDPREELIASVGDIDALELYNNQILVAIYKRPEKTAGGLYLADKTRDEDVYQGKVGLVIKKGPLAFQNDSRNDFQGQDVEVGDWIAYRVQDGWSLGVNGPNGKVPCRMLEDVHVRMRIKSPDEIY